MAEISTQEHDSTKNESQEKSSEAEPQGLQYPTAREIDGPLDPSPEHSPESQELQAELGIETEKYGKFDRSKSSSPSSWAGQSEVFRPNDVSKSELNSSDMVSDKNPIDSGAPLQNALEESRYVLSEEMRWKESLRLRHMHGSCHPSYFDSWTKEANLFFRRVVIINRRLENHRNKKRA